MCSTARARRASARSRWPPATAAIAEAVRAAGADAVLADADVPSGTDRVKLALDALDPDGAARRGGEPARRLPHPRPGAASAPCSAAGRPGAWTSAASSRRSEPPRKRRRPAGGEVRVRTSRRAPRWRRRSISRASGALGRGAALAPYRRLRLPPRGAGAFRRAAAEPAGGAREAGTAARAGSRHADRGGAGGARPVRRGHAGRPGTGAADSRRGER